MQRKKLRAATARRQRNLGLPDEFDFEQMSEPNMKLSRALLIVLMLHVVAVAGIIAFNTIKTRQIAAPAAATAVAAASSAPAAVSSATPAPSVVPAETANVGQVSNLPAAQVTNVHHKNSDGPAPVPAKATRVADKTPAVADSGKTYTVVRGDNPVTIARKLHVSYDSLLALNGIDDPRKLQIGQKLRVPERTTTTATKTKRKSQSGE